MNILSANDLYKRTATHICEMLEDQGFLNADAHDDNMEIATKEIYPNSIEFTHHQDQDKTCVILFLNQDNIIKRDSIRKLMNTDKKNTRYMLIVMNMDIIKHLKGICKTHKDFKQLIIQTSMNPNISVFKLRDFDFNKSRHIFQPKFRLLNKKDTDILIDRIGGIEKIPKMFDYDPMAKYYNVKVEANKRAVFEILKPSETSSHLTTYRHVVPYYMES